MYTSVHMYINTPERSTKRWSESLRNLRAYECMRP